MELCEGAKRPSCNTKLDSDLITIAQEGRDLGFILQNDCSIEKDTARTTAEFICSSKNMRVAFHYMNKVLMRKLSVLEIQIRLEYAALLLKE